MIEVNQAIKGFNRITRSLAAITFKSRKLKSGEFRFRMLYLVWYSPLVSHKLILLSSHYICAIGFVKEDKIIQSELQDKYDLRENFVFLLRFPLFYNVIKLVFV